MFVPGQIIYAVSPYPNLFLFQMLLISIVIITFYVIKIYRRISLELYLQIKSDNNLKVIYIQFEKCQRALFLIVIAIFISIWFVLGLHQKYYMDLTYLGLYGSALIFISLFVTILGFGLYVLLLWFLYNFNFYFPADTKWLVKIVSLTRFMSNRFFILGIMYSVIFVVLIMGTGMGEILPVDRWTELIFDYYIRFNNFQKLFSFLSVFSGLPLFITVMFPIFKFIEVKAIKKIVGNLKESAIDELQKHLKNSIPVNNENLSVHKEIVTFIKGIKDSSSYPIPSRNYTPYITTVVSVLIQIVALRIFS